MKIGIIGAGVMGIGVAQSAAEANYNVTVIDLTEQILQHAESLLYKNIKFNSLFQKQKTIEVQDIKDKITFSTDYDLLQDVDLIVENTTESWEIKKEVYKKLNLICKKDCIYLVNTSCISITKIASIMHTPSNVIGVHFMNPVHLKPTVEGIRGYHTTEDTIHRTKEFLSSMGKEMVLVNDYPGFVSNRISHLFMNEAAFVVQDGVADPKEVDEIFKKCYGHKMGPLETADLIGIDTVVNSLEILYESYQDPKFRCCPLLKKMVDAGLHGKKTGEGFYKYTI
ncbi:3-hydroxyacyl-CoA dehydrogenase family protein [Chengkuizengella marina]|uniref:3-hydroxyacyl-CoA dehydrogenase family protein n=1 Tax=Chengkuizengella marina TaxID=2507566 RepID=A0A6N9Q747_9BACL|nr:3-hydroxyacyl-CoA dehydrogenase family protein [Chengkuizengella marina]NBI30600.1 3-hydroxyacyl-CoA dehydrogenase family protein [Chengkuizengella marina]